MTKEEIKNKIAGNNNFDSFERAIRYTFNRELLYSEKEFIDKLIDESMQEYSDQENKRLTAIVSKQDEVVAKLKVIIENEEKRPIVIDSKEDMLLFKDWVREARKLLKESEQLESELSKL